MEYTFSPTASQESRPFKQLIHNFFQLLHPTIALSTISLFVRSLRYPSLIHSTSIIPILYKAFDLYGISFSFDLIPLSAPLQLPLVLMLQSVSTNRWIHRKVIVSASVFFIKDTYAARLRLRVRAKYQCYPQLMKRLYNNILTSQRVRLQPFL